MKFLSKILSAIALAHFLTSLPITAASASGPIKVFILARQSNMEGKGGMLEFRKAQEEGTRRIPNAIFVKTTDFARPAELSPNPSHGHHWFGTAESYFLLGDALGEGMKTLLQHPKTR